jgi:hypothetical protein
MDFSSVNKLFLPIHPIPPPENLLFLFNLFVPRFPRQNAGGSFTEEEDQEKDIDDVEEGAKEGGEIEHGQMEMVGNQRDARIVQPGEENLEGYRELFNLL